jgi:dihydrofolate reductase
VTAPATPAAERPAEPVAVHHGAPTVSLIVAATDAEVIGDRNDLPWHLRADLQRFKRMTMGHTVVVGRLTHESILRRLGKPMPGRNVVVVSRTPAPDGAPPTLASPDAALELAREWETGGEVFVIGGAQLYIAALPLVERVHLTRVHADIPGDTVMPSGWLDGFRVVATEPGPAEDGQPGYTWLTYERV